MVETLVLIEHDRQCVKRPSLHGITLARQLGGAYALLVLGQGLDEIAASLVFYGASAVIVADNPALAEPLADRYAAVIAQAAQKHNSRTVLGISSTFGKDVLPRAAALLDVPMVSDVLAIEEKNGSNSYRRPVNAGTMLATVKLESDRRVLTARATAFEAPAANAGACPIERFEFDAASLPNGMEFISREQRISDRPDLTEAAVVVCGGRPLKDQETFERLARSSRRSYILALASPARSSIWLVSKIRGSSSRSTKTQTHQFFRWPLTDWSATYIKSFHNLSTCSAEVRRPRKKVLTCRHLAKRNTFDLFPLQGT